jgi:hypothetical protein
MHQADSLTRRVAGSAAILAMIAAPAPASALEAAEPFLAPGDAPSYARALRCLTEAVYYEARSESDDGQRAVAQVVLNRVRHPAYPNSVCGVVYQGSERTTGCQFTFTCDGSIGRAIDQQSWSRAERVARAALRGQVYKPVGLALNYHTTAIRPYWAPSLVRQAVIGAHIFYRRPDSGSVTAFRQSPASAEPHAAWANARTTRQRVDRTAARYETARLEAATFERPRIERPKVERPIVERPASVPGFGAPPRAHRAAAPVQAQAQPRPAPVYRGPRTSIESGVRVSRGKS